MTTTALVTTVPNSTLDQSRAIKLVCCITAFYPNGGKNVTKGYIASLATVLMTYPIVAERCADPVHGVSRECKFLPTPAELIAWCDREMEAIARRERWKRIRDQTVANCEQDEYWERARAERPTLADMKRHYGPNWGITTPQRRALPYTPLTDDDLRKAYPPKDKPNGSSSISDGVDR